LILLEAEPLLKPNLPCNFNSPGGVWGSEVQGNVVKRAGAVAMKNSQTLKFRKSHH